MPPIQVFNEISSVPMVFEPKDYEAEFDGEAYLQHFYSKDAMEHGTRLCLFALPTFAALLQKTCPPDQRQTLIDIGAGPTVYSAVCFRNTCKKVYLADFLQQNLNHLDDWLQERRTFDWLPVIKVIARTEGMNMFPFRPEQLEQEAREVVLQGGLLRADVHDPDVVLDSEAKGREYDVLVSVFCLESACTEESEYRSALKNMIKLLRPGGYFILGSVIEDDCYTAGVKDGKVTFFTLLSLSEQCVLDALAENGCEPVQRLSLPHEGVMFLMARKTKA